MNPPNPKPKLNKQIYEEAAQWLVELRVGDVDADARTKLDAWFRESPHHIRAFLELSSIWEDGGDPDLDRRHSTDELIARARVANNIVPLGRGAMQTVTESDSTTPAIRTLAAGRALVPKKFSWHTVVAASFVGVALAGGIGFWLYNRMEPVYATGVGDERSIVLPDGSTLELNSRSRVRVRFSEHERAVDLVEGQALFHVAKDARRPFIVHSDSAQVRAVGTQFDVYRKSSGTVVTVLEGRVAVVPVPSEGSDASGRRAAEASGEGVGSGTQPIILAAGEQVTLAQSTTPKPAKADVAAATAWTQHELVFDSASLTDVAQEFNRYNVRQLVVSASDLRDFHVTGVFSSTDPSSLLRFLRAQRGISVEESDSQIRISKK